MQVFFFFFLNRFHIKKTKQNKNKTKQNKKRVLYNIL